jgi:oligoribonuclease NrnB/cAMP/cGMP phosphodiesterase (DHH superfamily)
MAQYKEKTNIKHTLKSKDIDFIIYHNPCSDGTGSAYTAYLFLSQNEPNKKMDYFSSATDMADTNTIIYFPTGHNAVYPDLTGRTVLFCDISPNKKFCDELIKKNITFIIIDHHITAINDLSDVPDTYKIFNINHSGAWLTWKYFFPHRKVPLMIEYIQDRDIWTNKLPHTDAFASWFHTLPHEIYEYDKYLDDDELLKMINTKGLPYVEQNNKYINRGLRCAKPKFIEIENKYYFVAFLNSTILKSDFGNKIFQKFPLIDFSAIYSINDNLNTTNFSLRSTDKHIDVSLIAKIFGSGGHRNASSVLMNTVTNVLIDQRSGTVYDNGYIYWNLKKIYCDTWTINNNQLNIVYINSTVHKTELGKYLLQTKYTECICKIKDDSCDNKKCINKDNLREVQECVTILRHISLDQNNYHHFDVAIVWDYNGQLNQTIFTLVFNKNMPINILKKIDEDYDCVSNDVIVHGVSKYFPLHRHDLIVKHEPNSSKKIDY